MELTTSIPVLFLIGTATFTDIKARRIPNWLTFGAAAAGIIFHLIQNGLPGGLFALEGILLGFILLFPAFLWGGLGAGDVKLLAAIGSFGGPHYVLSTGIYSILFGGAISLVLLIYHRRLLATLKQIWNYFTYLVFKIIFLKRFIKENPVIHEEGKEITFPFGVAISLGAIAAILLGV